MSNNKDFKVKNGIQPTVYHEAVGTAVSGSEGYSLVAASYDGVSFSVASQAATPAGVAFNSNGTKMYIVDNNFSDVHQYSLSTAFDLSTASYDSVSFSLSSQDTAPFGLFFKPDGTKMYISGYTNSNVYQYSLSTAFDISTASYDSVSFDLSSQLLLGAPAALLLSDDGTKMYMLSTADANVYQYSLSTAYDLSTASYDSVSFDVSNEDALSFGISFNSGGTKMYMSGFNSKSIYQYSLSTAFDLSTASYGSINFTVGSQDSTPRNTAFKSDGSKMYLVGAASGTIYQYSTALITNTLDLSTGSVFELTPTSDIQVTLTNPAASGTSSGATLLLDGAATSTYDIANAVYDSVSFNVASQEAGPAGLVFNDDGTRMYIVGSGSATVYQYSLSTGFDLSTASYNSVSLGVSSEDTVPLGLTFNDDGTKMYVIGANNDNVYQYSLSTAYELSTASYDSVSFSVTSQDSSPQGVTFNTSGSKMYVIGLTNESVYQYTLSTNFDLSTASYDSVSFIVTSQGSGPREVVFNTDGTKMFVVGNVEDTVHQYSLSTAFDLSTSSYDSVSFSVASQAVSPLALAFSSDGTKLYISDSTNDTIYQYSTGFPATITYDPDLQWSNGTAPTSPAIGETDVLTFNTRDGGSTYQGVLAIDGAK